MTIQSRDYTRVVYCIYGVLEGLYGILESLYVGIFTPKYTITWYHMTGVAF